MSDFQKRLAGWRKVAERHGCEFKNCRFVEGPGGTVSVRAVRRELPMELRVPDALLIDVKGIELTDHGQRVLPEYCADAALRAMLDDMLAYILSPARLESLRALYRAFSELPAPLAKRLRELGLVTQLFTKDLPQWLREGVPLPKELLPTWIEPDDKTLRRRLLMARVLRRAQDKVVFMPFIDFINHDPSGTNFSLGDEGINVRGKASDSGELFVVYNRDDTWELLNEYSFPGGSLFAFSVVCKTALADGKTLIIHRRTKEFDLAEDGLRLSKFDQEGDTLTLAHVWIGAVGAPISPYHSFARVWEALGRDDALPVFGQIVRHNWAVMRELRCLCQDIDTPAGQMLRTALDRHMRVMGQQQVG